MTAARPPGVWADALLAAALLALDPAGLGGVALHAPAGPVRDAWMVAFRARLDPAVPMRRMPAQIADDRLLGGLDVAATLRAGRKVSARGLLAELDGGVLVAAMAERMSTAIAARLAATLDSGVVAVEREGVAEQPASRFGLVLLDEGEAEDEQPSAALLDRLAFRIDLSGLGVRDLAPADEADEAGGAVALPLAAVRCGESVVEALCGTALALGVWSVRASLLAVRAACAAAALAGRTTVTSEDAATAARLVLAPRATRLPEAPAQDQSEEAPDDAPAPDDAGHDDDPEAVTDGTLDDLVLAAAEAAVPAGLLARLLDGGMATTKLRKSGRAGAMKKSPSHGRPAGSRPGDPRAGQRLDAIATVRAAAPWQALRRAEGGATGGRLLLRRDDFRVVRRRQRSASIAIFVVDASGSAALNRLAEAKGAVELLLAECYVRRDQVALIAFRGRQAELLLPPTRSLARARRMLAGLPGGGGTPLCAGIEAATELAESVRRRGQSPLVVLLTDGRPNVARDGAGGRRQAEADTLQAGQRLRAAGLPALMVDVAPMPHPFAREIAGAMGARYLALPAAQSAAISRAVQTALAA